MGIQSSRFGIEALGLALPSHAMDVRELAQLRGADPAKFTKGLGCDTFGVCAEGEDVVDLATRAAERALARWGGDVSRIGMIAVGTETAKDMSRPLSAFVADRLQLEGAIRSYEVKHACYGGTLALRQAVEWQASGVAQGKVALVIAADVARYTPEGPAEPTQGAGAVAFIVGEGCGLVMDLRTHAFSAPAFDFWRPVGESYPRVEGKLSVACYNRSVVETFQAKFGKAFTPSDLDAFKALCFHVPFPKMVKKGVLALGETLDWTRDAASDLFESRVASDHAWNALSGNAYTASLWLSVAHAAARLTEGDRLLAFSYGSGFGAELLELAVGTNQGAVDASEDIAQDVAGRTLLSAEAYDALRRQESPVVEPELA